MGVTSDTYKQDLVQCGADPINSMSEPLDLQMDHESMLLRILRTL